MRAWKSALVAKMSLSKLYVRAVFYCTKYCMFVRYVLCRVWYYLSPGRERAGSSNYSVLQQSLFSCHHRRSSDYSTGGNQHGGTRDLRWAELVGARSRWRVGRRSLAEWIITNSTFFDTIEIITLLRSEYSLHHRDGEVLGPAVQRDSQTLAPGHYVILAPDGSPLGLPINDEPVHMRVMSCLATPRALCHLRNTGVR